MRMWNLNPRKMCNKHLLGEHVEMHMFLGAIRKNKSIEGYIFNGLVEVHNIIKRHDILALEMLRRGIQHKSPLYGKQLLWTEGKVNILKSEKDLIERCPSCYELSLN